MSDSISLDKKSLRDLKKLYENAVANGLTEFQFQGKTLVTAYAKYVIEYAETQLKICKQ